MKKILLAIVIIFSMSFNSFKVYTYQEIFYSSADATTDQTREEGWVANHGYSLISSSIDHFSAAPPFPELWGVKIKYQDNPQ